MNWGGTGEGQWFGDTTVRPQMRKKISEEGSRRKEKETVGGDDAKCGLLAPGQP